MNPANLPSDRLALVGSIVPASHAPGPVSTGWVAAKDFDKFLAVVEGGVLGTDGTLDAKLEQASASDGTGVKDVTGKAITQIVASSKQALINLRTDELDVANGFDYVRLTITIGDTTSPASATSLASGLLFGFDARYAPGSHAASMVEAVA